MEILTINTDSNKILETPCEYCLDIRGYTNIVKEMIDYCKNRENNCVGLAANQIGINQSFFVMQTSKASSDYRVCFNPEIMSHGKDIITATEGCKSYPGIYKPVSRYRIIEVSYMSENYQVIHEKYTNFEARIFQHELDHLLGKSF